VSGDAFKKVRSSEPLRIPAAAYNAFIDAAKDFESPAHDQRRHVAQTLRSAGIVLVKNASGAVRGRFHILGIDSPLFTPDVAENEFKNRITISGITPATADHTGRFAILLEPLGVNAIGWACVAGVCPARVDVTNVAHEYAEIKDAEAGYLASASHGSALILWRAGGTGEQWAILSLVGAAPELPDGTNLGDLLYWNPTTKLWTVLPAASKPAILTFKAGTGLQWVELTTKYTAAYLNTAEDEVIADYARWH